MAYSDKELAEACIDIYDAGVEANYSQIFSHIPIVGTVGRLAHLLDTLRFKIKKGEHVLGLPKLLAILTVYPISSLGVKEDLKLLEEKFKAIRLEEGEKYRILLSSVEEVYAICANYFKENSENQNFDKLFVTTLLNLKTPLNKKGILNSCGTPQDCLQILHFLVRCRLIVYIEEFDLYYNTKFWKGQKSVIDFYTSSKFAQTNITKFLELMEHNPVVPAEAVSELEQKDQSELSIFGLLDKVRVSIGKDNKDFLFLPDSLQDEKFYAIKESAAYFKYNELYADSQYGSLGDKFFNTLNKLVREGSVGGATNIGKNYYPLEEKRIIEVKKGGLRGLPHMYVIKEDVIEDMLKLFEGDITYKLKQTNQPKSLWDSIQSPLQTRLTEQDYLEKSKRKDLVSLLRDSGEF